MSNSLTFRMLSDDERFEYAALRNAFLEVRDGRQNDFDKAHSSLMRGYLLMAALGIGIFSFAKSGYYFIKGITRDNEKQFVRLFGKWKDFFARVKPAHNCDKIDWSAFPTLPYGVLSLGYPSLSSRLAQEANMNGRSMICPVCKKGRLEKIDESPQQITAICNHCEKMVTMKTRFGKIVEIAVPGFAAAGAITAIVVATANHDTLGEGLVTIGDALSNVLDMF